jgi:hypothetical protein
VLHVARKLLEAGTEQWNVDPIIRLVPIQGMTNLMPTLAPNERYGDVLVSLSFTHQKEAAILYP